MPYGWFASGVNLEELVVPRKAVLLSALAKKTCDLCLLRSVVTSRGGFAFGVSLKDLVVPRKAVLL